MELYKIVPIGWNSFNENFKSYYHATKHERTTSHGIKLKPYFKVVKRFTICGIDKVIKETDSNKGLEYLITELCHISKV